jgi:hypothetical protein
MTRAAITAELAALDARRAELEQLSADLDNGQLTPKQIERYPVIDRNPIPSTQTRCIHYAGPHELVSKRHHDACCCSQCIWNDTAEAFAIPATLADESHEEASV